MYDRHSCLSKGERHSSVPERRDFPFIIFQFSFLISKHTAKKELGDLLMKNEKCEMRYGKSSECRSDYGEANEKQDRQECLSYGGGECTSR
jgi:hypothetical protein